MYIMNQLKVEICYAPIIQSGGHYQLKFSTVRWVWFIYYIVLFKMCSYIVLMRDSILVLSCVVQEYDTNHTVLIFVELCLWNRHKYVNSLISLYYELLASNGAFTVFYLHWPGISTIQHELTTSQIIYIYRLPRQY